MKPVSWSFEDDVRILQHVAKHGATPEIASSALGCSPGFAAARWATIVLTAAAAGPSSARAPWMQWELSIVLQGCQEWAQATGSDGRQQLQGQLYEMLAHVLPGRSACAIRHIAKERLGGNLKQQQRRLQHFLRAVRAPDNFDQLLLMWAKFLHQQIHWGTAQQQQALAAQMLEQLQQKRAEDGLGEAAAAGAGVAAADRPVQLGDLFRASDAAGATPGQLQCQQQEQLQPGTGSGPGSPTATARGQGWLPDCGTAGHPLALQHCKSSSPPLQLLQQQQQQWELCACTGQEPLCPMSGSCKRRRHSVDGASGSASRHAAAAEAALASQQLSRRLQAVQQVLFNTAAAATGRAAVPAAIAATGFASAPLPSVPQLAAAAGQRLLGASCDAAAAAAAKSGPLLDREQGNVVEEHQQALAAALQHVEYVQQQLQNRLSALERAVQQEAELAAAQQQLLLLQPQQPPRQSLASFTGSSGCSMAGPQQVWQQQHQQQASPQTPVAAGTASPVLLQQHHQQQHEEPLAGLDSSTVFHAAAGAAGDAARPGSAHPKPHTPATPDSNHSSPPALASLAEAACVPLLPGATATTAIAANRPPHGCDLPACPAGDVSSVMWRPEAPSLLPLGAGVSRGPRSASCSFSRCPGCGAASSLAHQQQQQRRRRRQQARA